MSKVDGQVFKNILACWTAGITVVSVASERDWQAITVNSFASVSMTPPLVCLNIANRLDTRALHGARSAFFREHSFGPATGVGKAICRLLR